MKSQKIVMVDISWAIQVLICIAVLSAALGRLAYLIFNNEPWG